MTEGFEGYTGIPLEARQSMALTTEETTFAFALLVVMLMVFGAFFRAHYPHVRRMLSDLIQTKERKSMFDDAATRNAGGLGERLFHSFLAFQAVILTAVCLVVVARLSGLLSQLDGPRLGLVALGVWALLILYYWVRRMVYALLAYVFEDDMDRYGFWQTGYRAVFGLWSVVLYIPLVWLIFVVSQPWMAVFLLVFLYFCFRLCVIYKGIRIFYDKSGGIFYISLYLCALEILPLYFLYKGGIYLCNIIESSALWH